jgi:hypothetical protein
MNEVDRFWSHVEKTDGCWLWTGGLDRYGYGRFWNGERYVRAHRFAYELLVGPIPEGHDIDHVRKNGCTHRNCVHAPEHLEPVTRRVNLLRGDTLVAANAAKTHCPAGHPYDDENTCVSGGKRYCRACLRERTRERRAHLVVV